MAQVEKRKHKEYYEGMFVGDYKETLEFEVTSILALTNPYGEVPSVEERNEIVEILFDAYIEQTGKVPPGNQVQRLGNWILFETLTDSRPDKVSKEDYPVMTKRQLRTRHRREMATEHIPDTLKTFDDNLAKRKNTKNFGGE